MLQSVISISIDATGPASLQSVYAGKFPVNMTDAILQVGPGVFIIAVVWIAALGFGIILLRAAGSAKLGVIPVFILALTITLALLFFPRHPEIPPSFKVIEIVDTLFIGRYILLAVAGLIFLVGFFMMLPFYFMEPVSAKAMRTF